MKTLNCIEHLTTQLRNLTDSYLGIGQDILSFTQGGHLIRVRRIAQGSKTELALNHKI